VNQGNRLCPTCDRMTQDIVGHLVAECTTFNNIRTDIVNEITDRLGVNVAVRVFQQPDERLVEIVLGAEVVEEDVEAESWECFILAVAKIIKPLASMALKHTIWKDSSLEI